MEERDRTRLRVLAASALALGVLLRLLAPFVMDVWEDGGEYVAMGHAWMERGEFYLPFGEGRIVPPAEGPGYSHHYPPAYPFFLGVVFSVLGFGLAQAKLAAVLVSLAALGAVFLATRDLYGGHVALLVAGLVAVEPHLLWVTGTGYSENMVLLFFTLTMWAILKSLQDERFIVLAGLFAGLAYLSRASVGYFFVVAGMGGFLWRFHFMRWKVFRNVWYMGAIAVFGTIVGLWAWRNVALFGWPHWQTSSYLATANAYAFDHPGEWIQGILGKFPFFALTLAFYLIPLAAFVRPALRRVREEHTSALFLSVALVWLMAWLVTGTFWPYEGRSFFFLEHHRYVVIGLVPLAWLLLREAHSSRDLLPRWGFLAATMLLLCVLVVASPVRAADKRAAEDLDPHLRPGDKVLVARFYAYEIYPYMSEPSQVQLLVSVPPDGSTPEFILTKTRLDLGADSAYVLVGEYRQHHVFGADTSAYLFAKREVAQERGIPTGLVRESW